MIRENWINSKDFTRGLSNYLFKRFLLEAQLKKESSIESCRNNEFEKEGSVQLNLAGTTSSNIHSWHM
jgi:hypothetical protein